ncbi:MAG TPA: hypothetical protein VGO80_16540 [Solirubrobacteraceae bacterium]|nr:hypothetical protein [Solirubrobacteraceae bacterium]
MSTPSAALERGATTTAARGETSGAAPVRRIGGLAVAAVIAAIGIVAVAQGLDGRATVRNALQLEGVVGTPQMTPGAIAAKARAAGLRDAALPTCSVAGKPVADGAAARCFAEYMRIDALVAAKGRTYAQLPRFATADGTGTSIPAQAQRGPGGEPVANPARELWVTQTALSNALNTSYMAEQVSLFGIAVGAAFVLVALALAGVAGRGLWMPSHARARARAHRRA